MKYKEKRINVLFVAAVKIRHMLSETNETKKMVSNDFKQRKKKNVLIPSIRGMQPDLGRQYIQARTCAQH